MELKRCITKSNTRPAGNWLSELRNQVNYQHLFGAWFPHEKRQIDKELIQAVSKAWTRPANTFDMESKHKELDRFFESTALLLSFFRELLNACMERAGDSDSVFQNGTLRLLKTVKAG
jgi:hypothetical protein